MYQHILVALDGSLHGQAAGEQAILLAKQLGARLIGVHVLDIGMLRSSTLHDFGGALGMEPQLHLRTQLETYMCSVGETLVAAFKQRCAEEGVEAEGFMKAANVVETLLELAHRNDLLVVGRHGSAWDLEPSSHPVGVTVQQLIRQSAVPVMVTGSSAIPLRRVVVGFDGSPGAWRGLKQVAMLAQKLNLRVVLAHVHAHEQTESSEVLRGALEYLAPLGVEATPRAVVGESLYQLLSQVEQEEADLLVVGYEGYSRWRELLLGHTPEALLQKLSQRLWVAR
ncbi:MAG: universal stress protein [Myxococcota bacterium]